MCFGHGLLVAEPRTKKIRWRSGEKSFTESSARDPNGVYETREVNVFVERDVLTGEVCPKCCGLRKVYRIYKWNHGREDRIAEQLCWRAKPMEVIVVQDGVAEITTPEYLGFIDEGEAPSPDNSIMDAGDFMDRERHTIVAKTVERLTNEGVVKLASLFDESKAKR